MADYSIVQCSIVVTEKEATLGKRSSMSEVVVDAVRSPIGERNGDLARMNPNGGAIALGHPLGATGAMLLANAARELVRANGEHALVTLCCGGGLGTDTLLRRG
jgi:acetyl-CoA C-acetyltransferase